MGELYRLDFPNGKSYIGITTQTANARFIAHRSVSKRAKKSDTVLYNAWRKHGEPKLVRLAIVEDHQLGETEVRAIKAFGTLYPGGYNMTIGGEESPMLNPEIAKKVSESMKGKKRSAEFCEKRSFAMLGNKQLKGYKHTPESREKMSLSRKGIKRSPEFGLKLSSILKGKPKSKEHIARMPKAARDWVAKMKLENPERYAEIVQRRNLAIKAAWSRKRSQK